MEEAKNEKIVELNRELEQKNELEKTMGEENESINNLMGEESLRVQKAKWIREEVEKQREIENAVRERIEQEQKILDEMKRSTEEHLERTKELRQFNKDTRRQMREQVYELNGLSEDKLQGMKEYKNAYYQGMALAFFLLSIALVGVSGYLHGFDSQICLFMIAFAGIEGALLSQESKRGRLLEVLCRFLYILMFPAMLVVFICYELEFTEYQVLLPFLVMAGCVILVLGTIAYFVYNPYRQDKKRIRSAKEDLKEIEDAAEKAVKRNQKRRKRQEARDARKQKREAKRSEKRFQQELQRQERKQKQETAKLIRKQKWNECKLLMKKKSEEMISKIEKKEDPEENILDAENVTPVEEPKK